MALSITGITSLPGPGSIGSMGSIGGAGLSAPAGGAGGTSFADTLSGALEGIQDKVNAADEMALGVATGDVTAAEYLTAATDAQLTVQLALAVRNRAVEAFNDVMRMPV